jgi:hypothetical protein
LIVTELRFGTSEHVAALAAGPSIEFSATGAGTNSAAMTSVRTPTVLLQSLTLLALSVAA